LHVPRLAVQNLRSRRFEERAIVAVVRLTDAIIESYRILIAANRFRDRKWLEEVTDSSVPRGVPESSCAPQNTKN